jgi:hypothetical protein
LRTLKSVLKHWQAAQKTERKSESESEIAMCDRMQMYNIKIIFLHTFKSVSAVEIPYSYHGAAILWSRVFRVFFSYRVFRVSSTWFGWRRFVNVWAFAISRFEIFIFVPKASRNFMIRVFVSASQMSRYFG